MSIIVAPFEIFQDTHGDPLEGGKIYIGSVNQNPETNPVTVYWDSSLTIPAVQPIRTSGGYPARSGTASNIFVGDAYSITVRDKNGKLVFTSLSQSNPSSEQASYDLIIDSNAKFDSWCQHVGGLFHRVLIKEGTWTASALSPTAGVLVNLDATGTRYIFAEPGAALVFSGAFAGTMYGLYRVTRQTNLNYERFIGINLTLTNTTANQNATGLIRMTNVSTPKVTVMAGAGAGVAVGFQDCVPLNYQSGTVSGAATSALVVRTLTGADSPYTAIPFMDEVLNIVSTLNPFILNLPSALQAGSWKLEVVNSSTASTGLVKIVPFAGDKIGPMAANVAAYLSNWDQSGAFKTKQSLKLIANGDSTITVAGGQLNPEPGSVDAAGSQYFLGKLHHVPLGNATNRAFAFTPAAATTFSPAKQVTGAFGIPAGAKAVLMYVQMNLSSTAGGLASMEIDFSDNNTTTPVTGGPHPRLWKQVKAVGAADVWEDSYQIIVPLNSSGQFYAYSQTPTNVALAACNLYCVCCGYYMGD